jgi:hypothetical protein
MAKEQQNTCERKRVESARQAQAGFLQGAITTTLLPRAASHAQPGVGQTYRTTQSRAVQLGRMTRTYTRRTIMSAQGLRNAGQRPV